MQSALPPRMLVRQENSQTTGISSTHSKGSMQRNHKTASQSTTNSTRQHGVLSDDDSGCVPEDTPEYAWTPPGLTSEQINKYFSGFPENLIPYIDSPGDRYRCCQLLKQLPPQDNEARYCSELTDDEQRELDDFARQRREHALGRGSVKQIFTSNNEHCEGCSESISELAVSASRAGNNMLWHPQCFKCTCCDEMLVDLVYFYDNGKLYCGRHHAEKLKPRCSNCDEIIFCEECTEAEGLFWHTHHFVCSSCSCALGGQRYIMRDQRPHCTDCFESDYGQKCFDCNEIIALDQGTVSYNGQIWHAKAGCFSCKYCEQTLLNRSFLPKFGMVFCSYDCSSRYEQTTSQILHQSVTPTGTQLQLAGLDDNLAYAHYQQDNATPVAVNPFKRGNACSQNHHNSSNSHQHHHHQPPAIQQAPIQVKPLVANPYSTVTEHSPFRPITPPKLEKMNSNGSNSFPPPPKLSLQNHQHDYQQNHQQSHQQNLQNNVILQQNLQNCQNMQNLSLQNLNLEFQQNLQQNQQNGQNLSLQQNINLNISSQPQNPHVQKPAQNPTQKLTQKPAQKPQIQPKPTVQHSMVHPPLPPKRTNSQLSNPNSETHLNVQNSGKHSKTGSITSSALSSGLVVQPLNLPSQTSLTNSSTMNKSVNFNQNPVQNPGYTHDTRNSQTGGSQTGSSINESNSQTNSLNGRTGQNGQNGQNGGLSKPKSILKTRQDEGVSQHHDFLKQFQRGSKQTQSLRRNKHENGLASEPECIIPFSQKSRRARSIEQDLNKIDFSDNLGKKGKKSSKQNRSFSYKEEDKRSNSKAGSDYYDSDSSSTLGDEDEDEDDLQGDWEHQAIALANSKIINPSSQKARAPKVQTVYGQSIDRKRNVGGTNTGSHTAFISTPASSDRTEELSRKAKNLAQFNRDTKKLNKKLKKDKRKHGKPCLQQ